MALLQNCLQMCRIHTRMGALYSTVPQFYKPIPKTTTARQNTEKQRILVHSPKHVPHCSYYSHSAAFFNGSLLHANRQTIRSVHSKSEADNQFIEFLTKEIESEKEGAAELPTLSGFQATADGPNVKLLKKISGETITVEFDVNNSVSSFDDADEVADVDTEVDVPEMMSSPDFTVSMQKDGVNTKLCLKCQLIHPSMNKDVPKEEADSFEIVELAMVKGEWTDDTYFVNADLLDANMYDMLMLMLEERGINHTTFCDDLVQFSSQHEHDEYVKLLESLQKFLQK